MPHIGAAADHGAVAAEDVAGVLVHVIPTCLARTGSSACPLISTTTGLARRQRHIEKRLAAEMLGDLHLAGEHCALPASTIRRCSGRTPTVTLSVPARRCLLAGRQGRGRTCRGPAISPSSPATDLGGEEIHARRADEAGDEQIGRMVVELERRADLLDHAGAQHDDAVGKRHRLDLVVRDEDHRRAEPAVQLVDLHPHLHAELGVEIGERLVEEEDAAARARWRGRWRRAGAGRRRAVRAGGRAAGSICRISAASRDAPLDLRLRRAHRLQAEGEVLAHRHVRVERVGLEHHGEAALGGGDVVDRLAVDDRSRRP